MVNLIEGEKYKVITSEDLPEYWNEEMRKFMGRLVTIKKVVSDWVSRNTEQGYVFIVEDGGVWYWSESDFEENIQKLDFEINEDFFI